MRNNPGITQSVSYIAAGCRLVTTKGLRRFVVLPLLVNLLIFGGLGWWVYALASTWLDSLALFSRWSDWWIVSALQTVLHWLLSSTLFFSLAFVFTLVANLVGAPFNGLLAERVEAHLTGRVADVAPSVLTLIKSVPRLMISELSKVIYLIVCLVPLLILQFIPVINFVAPLLLFLFGAWMFALEYMDYPMGNSGAVFRDVRKKCKQRRRLCLGFGGIVALISAVPVVNLFIMPVAVAGATALYVDHFRKTD